MRCQNDSMFCKLEMERFMLEVPQLASFRNWWMLSVERLGHQTQAPKVASIGLLLEYGIMSFYCLSKILWGSLVMDEAFSMFSREKLKSTGGFWIHNFRPQEGNFLKNNMQHNTCGLKNMSTNTL